MKYQTACPNCGARVSRWHIFFSPKIYHRCRGCGAMLGATATALVSTLVVVGIAILIGVLGRLQVIPVYIAIGLLLAMCGLAIWLLPYFPLVKLKAKVR